MATQRCRDATWLPTQQALPAATLYNKFSKVAIAWQCWGGTRFQAWPFSFPPCIRRCQVHPMTVSRTPLLRDAYLSALCSIDTSPPSSPRLRQSAPSCCPARPPGTRFISGRQIEGGVGLLSGHVPGVAAVGRTAAARGSGVSMGTLQERRGKASLPTR